MNVITRMTDVLLRKYGFYVPVSEIGVESHILYKEEIDEQLIAREVIDHLADPISTESANYTDTEGNYYLLIQVEIGNIEPYEVWLVNGEVVNKFTEGVE